MTTTFIPSVSRTESGFVFDLNVPIPDPITTEKIQERPWPMRYMQVGESVNLGKLEYMRAKSLSATVSKLQKRGHKYVFRKLTPGWPAVYRVWRIK